jgi:hypothetical protein
VQPLELLGEKLLGFALGREPALGTLPALAVLVGVSS